MYSSDLVDQQISIAKNNEGKIQFDSIIFGNGDYVQVLQCNVNFKDSGSNPVPVDPNNYDEQIKQLQEQIDQIKNAINDLRNNDNLQDLSIETIENDIYELSKEIQNLQTQISNLKKEFDENKEVNKKAFQAIMTLIIDLQQKVQNLQDQINNINVNPDNNNTGSTLKTGQFSIQTTQKKTPIQGQPLQATSDSQSKQYVFKFDSECTPQNVVDSLEANDDFMNIFLPVWDQETNQFIIFAKKSIPDQTSIVFNASGTVANMLGLYETKYLKIEHNSQKLIYNRFTNFPKITQKIELRFLSNVQMIDPQFIDFTDCYSHNDIRKKLAQSHRQIELLGTVSYDYCFDIIPYKDNPDKFILVLLIMNVYHNSFGNTIAINLTTDVNKEANLLKIIPMHEILNFEDKRNQMIQISEPFDLTDEETPFKPETNYLYIDNQTQYILETVCQDYEYRDSAINHKYNHECTLSFYDHTDNKVIIFDKQLREVDQLYKDEFIQEWNDNEISQYLEVQQNTGSNLYFKCSFKPTELYNSHEISWINQPNYLFWFDQYNLINNNAKKQVGNNTIEYLQMNNYPAFLTNYQFEIHFGSASLYSDSNLQQSLCFDFIMKDQLEKLKNQRVNQQNYKDNYTESGWYLNHNDFRNIWCTYWDLTAYYNNQSYIAYVEMNYDYTKNQWYFEITIPPGNNNHVWTLWFVGDTHSGNFLGNVMKLVSDNESLNVSNLWNELFPIELKDEGTYRFYTPTTVYKQDTINIDTKQPVNFNSQESLLNQWTEHNKSTQDTTVRFKDFRTGQQYEFNMSKDCSFYEVINEWNNSSVGQYFLAQEQYNVVQNQNLLTVYFELKLEEQLNLGNNMYGQGILLKWDNGEQASTWFNNNNQIYSGQGDFIIPYDNDDNDFQENVIIFDQTLYWNQDLITSQTMLNSSNKMLKQILQKFKPTSVSQTPSQPTKHDISYLKLYSDDLKATYKDLNNNFSKNGLVAVITENNYQPTTTKLYKIQGNAQPITFYLKDQDDKPYTNEVVLQLQFYKNSVIQQ